MKLIKTNKLANLKLNTESLKVLTAEQLGSVQGGQARRTNFSCDINLCISINAC